MTSTSVERLTRIQKIYPGAIGRGVIEGSQHMVRRQLRIWEKRGEVIALRRFECVDRHAGTTRIPYVRLKTRKQVRREQAIKIVTLASLGLSFVSTVVWLAWEVRFLILSAAGVTALGASMLLLWPHWTRGCSGLHCSGCKG